MSLDEESRNDELLVLASMYNEKFTQASDNGGSMEIDLKLPHHVTVSSFNGKYIKLSLF